MKLEDFNLTNEQLIKVEKYVKLLITYNEKFNLISKHSVADIFDRHIVDCLQLVKYINNKPSTKIADLGSGAGLPGLVLAIVLEEVNFSLIESSGKKASFLQVVVDELQLKNVNVINKRIEKIDYKTQCFNIITARALANLNTLWGMSERILCKNGYTLFLKGKKHKEELELLLKRNKTLNVELLDALIAESKIIKIHRKEYDA